MPTTVNRDNYDQVEFEMAKAAPDSCLTQPMRDEVTKGLRGWISKLRNTLSGLLRAADQPDNLATITGDGAIFVPAVKQWPESLEVANASGADVDLTFDQFAEAGIDGEAADLWVRVSGNPNHYGKYHFKSITKDEVVVTITDVTGDLEVTLRATETPKAGTPATS